MQTSCATPKGRIIALFLMMTLLAQSALAQRSESTASLLLRFDNEHDLAAKEHLLLTITNMDTDAGPLLLGLAESTTNLDTRWMAMRGMATLRCTTCAPFLVASLKDPDWGVRASAARALGDLRIRDASDALLTMFSAEREPGGVEQASLALRLIEVKAAAPYIREKIPAFKGQTRAWLIQALGALGNATSDVPLIAGYLDDLSGGLTAAEAIGELAGVSFGRLRPSGPTAIPTPETVAGQAWWTSHKDAWPRCDDCRLK